MNGQVHPDRKGCLRVSSIKCTDFHTHLLIESNDHLLCLKLYLSVGICPLTDVNGCPIAADLQISNFNLLSYRRPNIHFATILKPKVS